MIPRCGPAATARGHPRGVLVFLSGFKGVFDRCLWPDLPGREVDAPAGVDWVAFEDAGQLLEIDRQGPQHRRWAAAELSIELVGEVIVPDPASLPERKTEPVSEFGRSFNALHDGGDQPVASELQRVIVATGVLQHVNDNRAVAPVDSRPQGGSLFLGVHLSCIVLRSGL